MMDLPRLRPEPIPALHPVPEYSVTGRRRQWYAEIKHALGVPWMGVVTMAFAHYAHFFEALWTGVRPLVATRAFVDACREVRAFAESQVDTLGPAPITARLRDCGYAARELDGIREVVEIFSHGNFPYLMIATLARYLMEGGTLRHSSIEAPAPSRSVARSGPPLVLMEAHHADAPTRELYEHVKRTLGLPFVNTDYRALARWPSYFAVAWHELEPHLARPAYQAVVQGIHDRAVRFVDGTLPNPGDLSGAALWHAAAKDGSCDEVLQVVRLFQWLLPGLVTNVEIFRAQLRRT